MSLFDPSKMAIKRESGATPPTAPPSNPATGSNQPPISVSQLAALIDTSLRDHLPRRIRVVGEISGLNERTHLYFNLKDPEAVISCVAFASSVRAFKFRPENGHQVVASGRVEFFAKQGRTQFYVEKLEPVGAGALDLEFKRLCDELRSLGWFAPERKRPLPKFPRRIAVITSRTGAALQDVIDTVRRRAPWVVVSLIDVRVQGDGAAQQITSAVRRVSAHHEQFDIDALLITRGGGSKEDLWAFNDRALAQAIVECEIPVVAAIGHETDTTIAELVADERCATPTQAAMRLTPDASALRDQVESTANRLRIVTSRLVKHTADRARVAGPRLTSLTRSRLHEIAARIERLGARIESHRPAALHARRDADLARLQDRLHAAMLAALATAGADTEAKRLSDAMARLIQRQDQAINAADRALTLVGPASVLSRGYTCTLAPDGRAITSASQAPAGTRVRTLTADGQFESIVTPPDASTPPPVRLPAKRPSKPRSKTDDASPSLFS